MKGFKFLGVILGLLFSLVISLSSVYPQEVTTIRDVLVSPDELVRMVDDPNVRIIDARPPEKYKLSHIKNAINIWHADLYDPTALKGIILSPTELEKKIRSYGINNENIVVIYCTKGKFAGRIFWILDYLGHKNLKMLNGGFGIWRRKNYPVTTEVRSFGLGNFAANPDPSKIATKNYVLAHLSDPDVVIIDARTAAEYAGKITMTERAGHIKGAINIDWRENVTRSGQFKPVEELKRIYEAKGVTKDKEAIGYCCTSVRAGNTYLVLRYLLGYPMVRVYDGAFMEWGTDSTTPIE